MLGIEECIRELKLMSLMDDILWSPNKQNLIKVEKTWYGKIKNEDTRLYDKLVEASKYGVITGSCVLKLYGMIGRDPGDIDMIFKEDNELYDEFCEGKEEYIHDIYKDLDDKEDLECYKAFRTGDGYRIDLFGTNINESDIFEYEGIRYEHPFVVINQKMKLFKSNTRQKDIDDFYHILNEFEDK